MAVAITTSATAIDIDFGNVRFNLKKGITNVSKQISDDKTIGIVNFFTIIPSSTEAVVIDVSKYDITLNSSPISGSDNTTKALNLYNSVI